MAKDELFQESEKEKEERERKRKEAEAKYEEAVEHGEPISILRKKGNHKQITTSISEYKLLCNILSKEHSIIFLFLNW